MSNRLFPPLELSNFAGNLGVDQIYVDEDLLRRSYVFRMKYRGVWLNDEVYVDTFKEYPEQLTDAVVNAVLDIEDYLNPLWG